MSTIAAIATPPGAGGISIIRISGPGAQEVLARIFRPGSATFRTFEPWRLHRGLVHDGNGEALDDALAVWMPGPATFTGEEVVEIHCHGGNFVAHAVLESVLSAGAQMAAPGEFSRRAFLNGRIDLSQAEAIAEIIGAPGRDALRYSLGRLQGHLSRRVAKIGEKLADLRAQACVAVDFPDDETPVLSPASFAARICILREEAIGLLAGARRANIFQNGVSVLLAGSVNAGKSSLFNALSGSDRALVTEIPGTTRDYIEAGLNLDGLIMRLLDTAGLRAEKRPADLVEEMGMQRSREMISNVDIVVMVLDGASHESCAQTPDPVSAEIMSLAADTPMLLVWNKSDIANPAVFPPIWWNARPAICVSALTGENIDALATMLRELALQDSPPSSEVQIAPNARQAKALSAGISELDMLEQDLMTGQSFDCCVTRLDIAAAHFAEISGISTHADLLDRIFSQFCIGK